MVGVLAAAVRVEDCSGRRVLSSDRVAQGVGDQLGAQVVGVAQPTTLRVAMSMTVARNNQP
ncbi:hypothetical protein [Streptomyces sp. SID3343]|uniref:hypothetical protein n=1 Tax=Streptomyces sp. SID3343 TaxID=2690260 RepID=UPI001F17CEED|nr:hypothetical protein [Streptomyces sp. SID3343]